MSQGVLDNIGDRSRPGLGRGRRVQDVLPVIGEEHAKYRPILLLALKIAQTANHTNVGLQFERMLQKLGQ